MKWFAYILLICLTLVTACRSTGKPVEIRQAPPEPVTTTAIQSARPRIGFSSRQKLNDHFDKHSREFGRISRDEYLRQAQGLRDRAAGGQVLEIIRSDGVITRFDRETGAFLAFDPDFTIRTFFKPNDGEAYFLRQARRSPRNR